MSGAFWPRRKVSSGEGFPSAGKERKEVVLTASVIRLHVLLVVTVKAPVKALSMQMGLWEIARKDTTLRAWCGSLARRHISIYIYI